MGRDASCTLGWRGQAIPGRALLETDELLFRGDGGEPRIKIRRAAVTSVTVAGGTLRVGFGEDTAEFALGAAAEAWAKALVTRKSRLDKLGVAPGRVVSVVGVEDEAFRGELAERVGAFTDGSVAERSDLVFLGVDAPGDLAAVAGAKARLAPAGGIWILRRKGKGPVTEGEVRSAARAAGLVDVKVAAFSATHTADKFVIPVAARAKSTPRR